MKKIKFLMFAFIAVLTVSLTACSDDDDNTIPGDPSTMPAEIQKAFSEKFPKVKATSWTKKNSYYVVNFLKADTRAEAAKTSSAWFDENAKWKMTELDEDDLGSLPEAIVATLKASKYADWKVDDIDIVERENMQTIYVIEVEDGKVEYELYFSEDGVLMKEVLDSDDEDDDYLPEIPAQIIAHLDTCYAGYVVLDAEFDDGEYEIEFKFGNVEYEISFDVNFNWLRTECEMEYDNLPIAVREYIEKNYPGAEIDDIDVISTKEGFWFEIEIETEDDEIEIKINDEGEILK